MQRNNLFLHETGYYNKKNRCYFMSYVYKLRGRIDSGNAGKWEEELLAEQKTHGDLSLDAGELDCMIQIVTQKATRERLVQDYQVDLLLHDRKCVVISDEMLQRYFPDIYPGCVQEMEQGVYLRQFAHVPIVSHPNDTDFSIRLKGFMRREKIESNVFAEGSSPQVVNTMVASQLAMSVDSVRMAGLAFRDQPNMHIFPILDQELSMHDILLLTRRDEDTPRIIREFRSWLLDFWERYN